MGAELLLSNRFFLHLSAIEAAVVPMGSSPLGANSNSFLLLFASAECTVKIGNATENFFYLHIVVSHDVFLQIKNVGLLPEIYLNYNILIKIMSNFKGWTDTGPAPTQQKRMFFYEHPHHFIL